MRRLPSASFTSGSWKMTIPIESSAKITPISRSLTWATFFANAGSSSTISAIEDAMNVAFRSEKRTNVRSRVTSRQRPPARSGWSSGAWTRVSTSRKATKVAALTANRIVKLDGCATEAISPATTPPTATPRFITRRWSAYAPGRRPGGARAASSADCAGQNEPLPAPQTT